VPSQLFRHCFSNGNSSENSRRCVGPTTHSPCVRDRSRSARCIVNCLAIRFLDSPARYPRAWEWHAASKLRSRRCSSSSCCSSCYYCSCYCCSCYCCYLLLLPSAATVVAGSSCVRRRGQLTAAVATPQLRLLQLLTAPAAASCYCCSW